MIKMTVDAAHEAGIWAGICGEIAADSTMTEVFLKMGVDELSVSPRAILPVRNVVRQTVVGK
jgi:phosphotransferase system enzyme I (PtsI)